MRGTSLGSGGATCGRKSYFAGIKMRASIASTCEIYSTNGEQLRRGRGRGASDWLATVMDPRTPADGSWSLKRPSSRVPWHARVTVRGGEGLRFLLRFPLRQTSCINNSNGADFGGLFLDEYNHDIQWFNRGKNGLHS